jgi:hypothetical protein
VAGSTRAPGGGLYTGPGGGLYTGLCDDPCYSFQPPRDAFLAALSDLGMEDVVNFLIQAGF